MVNKYLVFIINFVLTFFLLSYAVSVEKVSDSVYAAFGKTGLPSKENKGFMSNCYGILTEEGWVVIDALSTPSLAREFINEIKKIKNLPIKYLIITHYHLDHYFGIKAYKKENAKVVSHANLKKMVGTGELEEYLSMVKKSFPRLFEKVEIYAPDIVVEDSLTLKVGSKQLHIKTASPAHTNTDIIVYLPDTKEIFVGDLVFYNRIPFVADRYSSSKNWLRVLKELKSMDIKTIYNGHNRPLGKDAIDFTYEYISFLREEISKMKDEDIFYDEIKEKLMNTKWKNYPMFDVFHAKNIYKIYNELDFEF